MKKIFKTHPKHQQQQHHDDLDKDGQRAISPFTVVPNPPSPDPLVQDQSRFQQQQLYTHQQYATQRDRIHSEQLPHTRLQHYRNSLAAYPSPSNDDISSWELVQGHTQLNHPYRQRSAGVRNDDHRDRSASFASLSGSGSGSNSTLPNPYSHPSQRTHTPPYAHSHSHAYSASRTSSLNSLTASQPSPATATSAMPLITQSQPGAPPISAGSYAPSPTSPGPINTSNVASAVVSGLIGSAGGGVLRKKGPGQGQAGQAAGQSQGQGQAPIHTAPQHGQPQHQPPLTQPLQPHQRRQEPQPPPSQASTAAILRALDPSMGLLGGATVGPEPSLQQQQHKPGLMSRASIRSTQREREREQREGRQQLTQPLQYHQQQQQQSAHGHGHGHLRVPVPGFTTHKSKSKAKRDLDREREPHQAPRHYSRSRSRSRSRSASRSLSDIEFNPRASATSAVLSGIDVDPGAAGTSPPSSINNDNDVTDHYSSRRPSSVYDPYVEGDLGADPFLERDSLEMERREREARWRERDLEIEGKIPVPLSGQVAGPGTGPRRKDKDKDKDRDRDKDRDSRGFFERLQFGDTDGAGKGDSLKEKKDKKEKDDWKAQITSIFSGKDKDKDKDKERSKKHRDLERSDSLTPYHLPPASHQHPYPEISSPVPYPSAPSPYALAHPYANTPPPPNAQAFNDLAAYYTTTAANAPVFSIPVYSQPPTQPQTQAMQNLALTAPGTDHLARMVGLFVSPSAEGIDWALALELCEQTKGCEKSEKNGKDGKSAREGSREGRETKDANGNNGNGNGRDAKEAEANAKSIAKALRKELKYARPSEQLGAVTLWAVMLQNASDFFITQTSSRKFLDVVEDVIVHSRNTAIRERLLEVLGAAAYLANQKGGKDASKRENFKAVWRKVKPDSFPDEGMPLSMDNPMFHSQSASLHANGDAERLRSRPPMNSRRSSRNGIIPIDEDIRRLFQECKMGRGNAQLLNEALAFATPEDLKEKDIIKEFYAKCRASQELIHAQIPWASAGAERSRLRQQESLAPDQNIDDLPSTREEKLLAELLSANEELSDALHIYEDIERIGVESEAERRARERSKVEIRASPMDYQNSGDASNFLAAPSIAPSSSRSQSPSSFLMNSQVSQTSNLQSSDPSKYTAAADSVPMSAAAFYQQQQHQLAQVQVQQAAPNPSSGWESSHNLSHTHNPSHTQSQTPAPGHLAPVPSRLLHGPRSPPPPSGAAVAAAAAVGVAAGIGVGGVHSRTSSPIRVSRPNSVVHSRATSLDTNLDASSELNANLEREDSDQTAMYGSSVSPGPRDDLVSPESCEPLRLSEKAAGKKRMADDSAGLPGFVDTPNGDVLQVADPALDSLHSEFDTDDAYHDDDAAIPDRWKPRVHYAYDAAAERTKERLRELAIAGHG